MVARRIVVCLDVAGGRVVKGTRFRRLRAIGDPVRMAARYESEGADEVVLLQVDGSTRRPLEPRLVRDVARALAIPLTVGGGIRRRDQAEALLAAGADRVSLNSAALRDPGLLERVADRCGRQAVVLAIDAAHGGRGRFPVFSHGGTTPTDREVGSWAREGCRRGAGEVLLTSIDRDGTRAGYDLPLLRRVRAAVPVPIVASGGARDAASVLRAFRDGGADAALVAGMFHDRTTSPRAVKEYLGRRGIEVRP